MQLPRSVLVGSNVLGDTAKVCLDLKLNGTCLLVTGRKTLEVAGNKVISSLEEEGFEAEYLIVSEASAEEIARVKEAGENAGFLLGVGGGKAIDVAKLASTELEVPFISIPTAASHDGIVSNRASILEDGETVSRGAQTPLAVIADTQVIAQAPFRLLAAGCGDIISNYTAVRDWQLAHRLRNAPYSEYAASLSLMSAKILVDSAETIKPGLESSARLVMKALVSSGVAMSIAGSSRPASGSEHKFSHALNRITAKPALHGEQCGVGAIMMMYLHGGDWKSLRDALRQIGAPTTTEELGIPPGDIIEALVTAHKIRPERYTILGTGLTREAAINLAVKTKVVEKWKTTL